MTDAEFESALRAYNRVRPFRPYLVEFFSGHQVVVTHPEGFAFYEPLWLYRGSKQQQSLVPSSSVCRLLDLTEGQ